MQGKLLRYLRIKRSNVLVARSGCRPNTRVLAGVAGRFFIKSEKELFATYLFYRLSSCQIDLPPLSGRAEDIPELVDFFLARYDVQIAGEAMEVLMNYAWPGNVMS